MIDEEIKHYIEDNFEKWRKIRRDLHRIAELSGEEYKTQAYIIDRLNGLGIENRKCGGTGVHAVIRTGRAGKTLAFRADMDGLPVQEQNETDYASVHYGCMHACGHDAHMTFLLGLAEVLKAFEKKLNGNFVFIFQPAEETISGAEWMIQDGVMDNPVVDAVIAAHVWKLPLGQILVKKGPVMASPVFLKWTSMVKAGMEPSHICASILFP